MDEDKKEGCEVSRADRCTCLGPTLNTHVDGNLGHNPMCLEHPRNWPVKRHPEYLEDEGDGSGFVRCDLAADAAEAVAWVTREGIAVPADYDVARVDSVWMQPTGAEIDSLYVVEARDFGIVKYWRLNP